MTRTNRTPPAQIPVPKQALAGIETAAADELWDQMCSAAAHWRASHPDTRSRRTKATNSHTPAETATA